VVAPVVAPTRTDPVAASFSEAIGGPLGRHALPHRWWTPVRVLLVLAAVVFSLAVVHSQPCLTTHWANDKARYGKMCYSDIPYLYSDRGLVEGRWPYAAPHRRYQVMEYPVGISYFAWFAAKATQATSLTRAGPPISERRADPSPMVYGLPGVIREVNNYFLVTAVLLAACLLGATWFVANTHRRRPWDALPFVLSPVLLATALVNWDLLAVLFVTAALWAWSRGRPGLTGVMIGLGAAAKLYPLFLLGPVLILAWRRRRNGGLGEAAWAVGGAAVAWVLANLPAWLTGFAQWKVFWRFNQERGADWGSLWLWLERHGHPTTVGTINLWSWILFGAVCLGVLVLGLVAEQPPRLAQLGYLVVAGFLLVNKVYSPQYVLWLLPLAVLARPRWRDLLIWQFGELLYYAAIWLNFGGWLAGSVGENPITYNWAIVARMAAEIYLAVVIVRDVLSAEHDPVDVGRGEADADVDLVADLGHR
jgi:uncharacterized membrane protein